MPALHSRSPRPVPAPVRTGVVAPRRRAAAARPSSASSSAQPPAKKRRLASVRGTYATRARREKADALFREYQRDRDEQLRNNPQRPGETRQEWRMRTRIPNDETLRAFAETDAGIGILTYESREAAWKDLGIL